MRKFVNRAGLAVAGLAALLVGGRAGAEPTRVTFPADLDALVHYTTVTRGNVTERMLTSQAVVDAIKAGKPVPNGAHFVLVENRDGALYRYFVMQKGEGWGAGYSPDRRTGDWQFQWFWPDRSINLAENTARCQSCHQGAGASNDFLFTAGRIK